MLDLAGARRVYIDTDVWIYLIEGNPDHVAHARALFLALGAAGAPAVTNELTVAECLTKLARDADEATIADYDRLFGSGEVELTALDGGLARRAAMVAGKLGLKLVDAIHYVAALEAECSLLVTGDRRFRSGPVMQVVHLGARPDEH
jgi:predicted nucleic acid-binding protein